MSYRFNNVFSGHYFFYNEDGWEKILYTYQGQLIVTNDYNLIELVNLIPYDVYLKGLLNGDEVAILIRDKGLK